MSNTEGGRNSAFGKDALLNNSYGTTSFGEDNSAFGFSALKNNTYGKYNSAFGAEALVFATTGSSNTAIGFRALSYNTQGSKNVGVGYHALFRVFGGSSNTALGHNALRYAYGSRNVAVGYKAGYNFNGGSNNIYLANEGDGFEDKQIKIGTVGLHEQAHIAGIFGNAVDSAQAVVVDQYGKLGSVIDGGGTITGITVSGGLTGAATVGVAMLGVDPTVLQARVDSCAPGTPIWGINQDGTVECDMTLSSIRFKEAVRDMGEASNTLMQLRPVTFRYREGVADGGENREYGLIAEEVAKVAPDLVVYDEEGRPYTVRYRVLPALLLNEMQKQQRTMEAQQRTIEGQGGQIETLLARVDLLASQIANDTTGMP